MKPKTTTVHNPQANAILERMHGVLGDMLCTSGLDMSETVTPNDIDNFIMNVAWAIFSTYHTILKSLPGAAIFGRDIMFDLPYLAHWISIGRRRQPLVDKTNKQENKRRLDFDYQVGHKVMIEQDGGKLRKVQVKYLGPYMITLVHTNRTIQIQCGSISEQNNIRGVIHYFEPIV